MRYRQQYQYNPVFILVWQILNNCLLRWSSLITNLLSIYINNSTFIIFYYLIPYINVIWDFLLFSKILKPSAFANCWPVNSSDCFPRVLWRYWRHRGLERPSILIINQTLRHILKVDLLSLIINICAKLFSYSWFSSASTIKTVFDQVIKQLFHTWF
jgi:hypothetical protein